MKNLMTLIYTIRDQIVNHFILKKDRLKTYACDKVDNKLVKKIILPY